VINPISLKPIEVFRSVAHSNGNEARRVTLPARWIRLYAYPKDVFVVFGNLVIVASVGDKDLALQAAQCLFENGLMQPIEAMENTKGIEDGDKEGEKDSSL